MRFQRDSKGLEGLLQSKEMQDVCVSGAERGAEYVRATGPRDDGDYIAGIDVERGRSLKGDRAAAHLVANAPNSAAVEFGNRRAKAQHPLQSAISIIEGR